MIIVGKRPVHPRGGRPDAPAAPARGRPLEALDLPGETSHDPLFSPGYDKIPFAGLDSDDPSLQGLRARPAGPGQAHGRAPALRRLLLAHVQLARLRCVRRGHVRPAVADAGRTRCRRARPGSTRRSSSSTKLGTPYFCFHDRDIAPEGEDVRRDEAQPRRAWSTRSTAHMARTGVKLLWGTANLFRIRATWRAPRPTRIPRCSPTPRPRSRHARGDPSTRRRELRAVGRPRRLRDAAQHRHGAASRTSSAASSRWWPSTSTRSASRARS